VELEGNDVLVADVRAYRDASLHNLIGRVSSRTGSVRDCRADSRLIDNPGAQGADHKPEQTALK
jgi:hypothetical protein